MKNCIFYLTALTFFVCAIGTTNTAQAETVTFGCGADPSMTCYFSIRYASGSAHRNFTMQGGTQDNISNVVPGNDYYLVSINQSPPTDPNQCGVSYWCKNAKIKSGYND
ncbi:hypothetical protein ABH906_004641 [Pseudomonas frederiksbergensis]